jgi:deazaflavin-dependent oxidoreductase (nitroreductase family)
MANNPMTEKEHKSLWRFVKLYGRLNTIVYKLTGGRVWGKVKEWDTCLVTMTGAKSGKRKTIPVMYVPYNNGTIMVASLGGAPRHPTWYYNLVAHPDIEVQYRSKKMKLRARQVSAEEKAQLWPTCVEHYPPYGDYQDRTDRDIPV